MRDEHAKTPIARSKPCDRRQASLERIVGLKDIRTCALGGPLVFLAVERRPTSGRQSRNAMSGGRPTARFAVGHRELKHSVRVLKGECGPRLTLNAITRKLFRLRPIPCPHVCFGHY